MIFGKLDVSLPSLGSFGETFSEVLRPDVPGPFQDAIKEALELIMTVQQTRFINYSNHGGDWPDHAPSTKLKKAYKAGFRRGRHPPGEETALEMAATFTFPLLRETDTLLNSIVAGQPFHEYVIEADGITSQSTVPYGIYHEIGGSTPGRPPRRQWLVQPEPDVLAEAAEIVAIGIDNAVTIAAISFEHGF